jgi:hypothetical protein
MHIPWARRLELQVPLGPTDRLPAPPPKITDQPSPISSHASLRENGE